MRVSGSGFKYMNMKENEKYEESFLQKLKLIPSWS
jgi:hypothetical protein